MTINECTSDWLTYRVATGSDCASLVELVNCSYYGELACQGWTNVNALVDGHRTNIDALYDIINTTESVILIFFDKVKQVQIGCASVQRKQDIKIAEIGMLAVRPDFQKRGYGKMILSVVEKYAIDQWNVDYIEMTVVIQRSELIAYYNRRGYTDTGQREPFPPDEFGRPKRNDLEFCTLRKCVKVVGEKLI